MRNFPKGKYLLIAFLVVFISTIAITIGLSLKKENNNTNPPEISTTTPDNKDNNSTTKTAMEKEIEEAESKSAYNKSQYQQKYLYYMSLDRFTGTQTSYNNRVYSINQEIGDAYAEYLRKVSEVNSSNIGQGYKEQLRKQYENEYNKKQRELSAEKENLEASWNNQQNYLRYYNLYLNEDSKLEEIEKIKNKYK